MRTFFHIVAVEFVKQHKRYFHSQLVYFSMLVWPALHFAQAYYTYRPFMEEQTLAIRFNGWSDGEMMRFILTGYLGYTFFFSLVQASWLNTLNERFGGTLELLFLTPANRLALLVGQSTGALLESVWLFLCFSGGLLVVTDQISAHPLWVLAALLVLVVLAVAWGTLLLSVMLFLRDSSLLYTVLEEPMRLFAGVAIPPNLLPLWGRMVGALFPLTFALRFLRLAMAPDVDNTRGVWMLMSGMAISVGMLALGWLFTAWGERRAKQRGSFVLF